MLSQQVAFAWAAAALLLINRAVVHAPPPRMVVVALSLTPMKRSDASPQSETVGSGHAAGKPRQSESLEFSRRKLEAISLRCTDRVDEGEDGEDDVLGKRSPGLVLTLEADVNGCQIAQIGARVCAAECCHREGQNP